MLAAIVVILAVALVAWYMAYLDEHRKQNRTVPLPIGMYIPYLGCAPLMALRPNTFLQELAKKHGDVFTVYLMGRYITVVNRAAFHPTFFRLDFYTALKDFELEEVMGQHSITFRTEDTMRVMRKRCDMPSFGETNPITLEKEMHRALELEALHRNEVVEDVLMVFNRVLLCMNSLLFLGERLAHHPKLQELLHDFHFIAKAVIRGPGPIGYFARRRCHRARKQILALIKDEIIYLRTYPAWLESEDDVTQCYLQDMMRTFGDDPAWTDDLFAEKVFSFLYATIANTPLVAVNTLMLILLDNDIRERVQEEVIIAHRIGGGRMTHQAMNSLQLLGWCIEESLRLVSLPLQVRRATTPTPVGGTDYIIPEGRIVGIVPAIFHLDPETFPDPAEFKPDRFRDIPTIASAPITPRSPRSSDTTPLHTPRTSNGGLLSSTLQGRRRSQTLDSKILSWGRGAHKCLGQELAYMEIRMLLAHLLHKYRVNLSPDRDSFEPIDLVTTGVSVFHNRKILFKSKLDLTMNLKEFRHQVLRRNRSMDKEPGSEFLTLSSPPNGESKPVLRRTKTTDVTSMTSCLQLPCDDRR